MEKPVLEGCKVAGREVFIHSALSEMKEMESPQLLSVSLEFMDMRNEHPLSLFCPL